MKIIKRYSVRDKIDISDTVWSNKIEQLQEKKEKIWLSPMTKAPTPTEKSKKQRNNKKRHQNFDYTTSANLLRTVNWSNDSHQTDVVKPVYGIPTFPLTTKAV